jgi:hypothetical protein
MSKLYIVALAILGFACGSKNDDKPAASAGEPAARSNTGEGDCIVGEYEWDDKGVKRGFVFTADKSGMEIYEPGKDERPLTWSIKVVHEVRRQHGRRVRPAVQLRQQDGRLGCDAVQAQVTRLRNAGTYAS